MTEPIGVTKEGRGWEKMYFSTKTYTFAEGLSCCFRQWRADSHCNKLHGYAIQVSFEFQTRELDDKNWVVDFGNLKWLKAWLHDTFDHKTLVAKDDPRISDIGILHHQGLIDLVIVPKTGCEGFAEYIFDTVSNRIMDEYGGRVLLMQVEVREHGGNSAGVYRSPAL